ncbi:xylulokinase, partial [Marinobacter sp. UBA2498]
MPAEPLILAIDNGTQSVRALLFDTSGNLVGKGKQEIEPYFSREPGWAEQHPDYFWEQLAEACQLLWSSTDATPDQVAGVTVTTQRGTVINLDENGQPLRPAIIWLDQRHARVEGPVKGPWGWLFKVARLADTINRFREKTQANWIAQNEPEIWAKTRHFLLLSGYLNYRLTGEFRDSTGSQVGYLPFDYKKHRWAGRRD